MRTEKCPYDYLIKENFPNRHGLAGFEGGSIWLAEKDGRYYVITDERTMAGFLDPEEDQDLLDQLVSIHEFDTEVEREQYIVERGWNRFRRSEADAYE